MIPNRWGTDYAAWLDEHRRALEDRDWATAFQCYPWVQMPDPPITRLSKSLTRARVAVVSSAGVSLVTQPPFDAENPLGDNSFRIIPGPFPLTAWQVHHGHYDTAPVQQDYNTVFPVDALRRLEQSGEIGSIAPEHYTFMGYQPDPRPFFEQAAPEIRERMKRHEVEVVLLVPG